jgi:hypothetical protein
MPTAWTALALCTIDDVYAEAAQLTIPLQIAAGTGEQDIAVQAKIDLTKDFIRQELQGSLPELFADRNGHYQGGHYGYGTGYTFTQLDTMLDKIQNPTELKHVAVAYALHALLVQGTLKHRTDYGANYELLDELLKHWTCEKKTRMARALRLLSFDLDSSGTIDDTERLRDKTTFHRV